MSHKSVPLWKEAPFLRLILPFIAGIILQWYFSIPLSASWTTLISASILLFIFQFAKAFIQFRFSWINGMLLNILIVCTAILITHYKNISRQPSSITNCYNNGDAVLVTLEEPLSEKERSFKALASVESITDDKQIKNVKGSILIYFKKDSALPKLRYGSQIIFSKPLAAIKNSGNPGAFDYARYCAFQNIYYQVYLQPTDFILLKKNNGNAIQRLLFSLREKTIAAFQKYIGGKNEAALAEALLIGYKDDLDKDLIQSYSNTALYIS